MTRRDDRKEAGMAGLQLAVGGGNRVLLALMGARGEPARPRVDLGAELRQLMGVDRQGRRCRFEVADGAGVPRAELGAPRPPRRLPPQAPREAAAQPRAQAGPAAPPFIGPL